MRPEPAIFVGGDELLAAIRGHHVPDHPVARLASRLGAAHRSELDATADPADLLWRRTGLIAAIDLWLTARLPVPRPGAPLHTESAGTMIDRIAGAQVHAYRLLMTVPPADPRVHSAWHRLAELVTGYTDCATEVVRGQRRLPILGDHW
ncbi:DUF4254 domain-containing protein [Nocardia cyriacigeorgica]|uniref:DUF4254 domain-containing protein n=1 Tax=Nocardia cyriacigeorgica TaxID=135487 RepID=A0A5R8NYA2_9NOCA|nr:DUF4254 domain-containing protein [Nocardia cyriacigeorgica]TLF81268.1 DUF4254 domain-containing protein [Nocardia cyriacigeorgica]